MWTVFAPDDWQLSGELWPSLLTLTCSRLPVRQTPRCHHFHSFVEITLNRNLISDYLTIRNVKLRISFFMLPWIIIQSILREKNHTLPTSLITVSCMSHDLPWFPCLLILLSWFWVLHRWMLADCAHLLSPALHGTQEKASYTAKWNPLCLFECLGRGPNVLRYQC